jgi:hypothetical protein
MSNRRDDRSSRMGNPNDPRGREGRGERGPDRGPPDPTYARGEDMGGSGWSGASGRGGMTYEGSSYAASHRGYGREGGYAGEQGYGHEHGHEGGYPGDRRHMSRGEEVYRDDRRFGHEGGYAAEPLQRTRSYESGALSESESGHRWHGGSDDAGFIEERGFGHVPGQRWSGGYGGDRDRAEQRSGPSGEVSGRGFTGSDFGGPPRSHERAYGAPAERAHAERHFGSPVDRGGRMGPGGGETTTGRGYWGWESDRASGVNVGPMGGREGWNREPAGEGHPFGFHGSDMGMGRMGASAEDERGPHWGKGPKGYKRSDDRTREDVCDAIAHQGQIDASDVEVKVADGIVTLSGTVAQRHHKRALEQLAERCRGVHEVHNELRLARPEARQEREEPKKQPAPTENNPAGGQGDGGSHKNGRAARS